jgi:uncharacterized alkaline shock family protein YloU
MRLFIALGVFFYTVVFFLIGGLLIAFALDWLTVDDINRTVQYLQLGFNARIITGLVGFLVIVINIFFAQLILGRIEKEKTIAFNTPTGQVTIALSAVEDLIKRLAQSFSEIKEMRPDVVASKRGVEVNLRVVLQSEANIPDLTSHLQETIKTKIQEMLGIEEQISVKVHVAKIISYREKRQKESTTEKEALPPFRGYGRT